MNKLLSYDFVYKSLRLGEIFDKNTSKPYRMNCLEIMKKSKTNTNWPNQDHVEIINELWAYYQEDILKSHPWLNPSLDK